MTLEDAIEQLNNRFGIDSWRRQDDQFDMAAVAAAGAGHHPAAAAAAAAAAGGFAGRGGYNPVAQPMPFAPPVINMLILFILYLHTILLCFLFVN